MKVISLTIGAWNVRALMDNSGSDRPERTTALVGRELDRYKVEIAALSETRLAQEGLLKEVGAGYTFFRSGRKKEERREAGVGFAIKSHLVSKLSGLPKGINDRLMTLRLPLSGKRQAKIVSAYAPTITNPDEVKDKFYDDLDSVISAAPRADKLILLGDFNARVGTDHNTWEGVIGSEGVGKWNSNGLLLLRKCAEHELLITNTVFRLPTRRKRTWLDPRSKQWHLIDYVIVRRKDRQDVRVTKTMCGADCRTDHKLVVSKLNLRIQPVRRPQGKKVPEKLDVSKLKQDSKRQAFVNDLCIRLDALEHSSEDVDESWTVLRDTVHSSAMDSLGPVSRTHQDWFDENDKESQGLLEEKHQNTRLTSEIPAQYLARLPIQIYARQFRRGSETCKTPGWEKRLMKSSPLQTERTWKSSLMHSRQYMVPRAQESPHSLVQMELVFWLTKKLSWKDGLNTLMVSLIGHHLSMMKLSTEYHRWNVIRCLMSSQPSLKQWKQ